MRHVIALGLLLTPAPAFAATWEAGEGLAVRMLALHNAARAEVGAPPLEWDPALAVAAASYGPALSTLPPGVLEHSPRDTRPGQRENLAMGWTETTSPEELIGLWTREKTIFFPGVFPAVSRTGKWEQVAHYTQMVWKTTTHVGCALYPAPNRWTYLICRYTPPGNLDGKVVP
jgi:hypothetical protein